MIENNIIDVLNDEVEENNRMIIRAKWTMDGATTLEEAANLLEEYAKYIRNLDKDWKLECDINDDYGFLVRK